MVDGDITKAEVREDVAKWEIKEVRFLPQTRICEVTYLKKEAGGKVISGEREKFILQNIPDNPDTGPDESNPEFNDLIAAINAGSNFFATVTSAVNIQRGI